MREYIGELYQIAEGGNLEYIGKELPDEYTEQIWSGNAKADSVQGILEMLTIGANTKYVANSFDSNVTFSFA